MQTITHKSPVLTRQQSTATAFYCVQGTVQVEAPDATLTLHAGDIAIVPVGAEVGSEDTGFYLPFEVPALTGASRTIALGHQWGPILVDAYVKQLEGDTGYLRIFDHVLTGRVAAPRLPKPIPALNVARAIIAHPAADTSLNEFASWQHVASRTLQRQFEASTGLSFSEWRAAYRVYVAAGLLMNGATLDRAAGMVGFGATSSLSRAFVRHTGTSPGKATRGRRNAMPQLMGRAISALSDVDQAFWIHCGTATVTAPNYCRFAAAGEMVTLLAGTQMQLEVAAGSVAIPVPVDLDRDVVDVADALALCEDLFLG